MGSDDESQQSGDGQIDERRGDDDENQERDGMGGRNVSDEWTMEGKLTRST